MKNVAIMAGARVRIRHKHSAFEGEGAWGVVRERHGKQILVIYDGAKRARSEHVANVVEAISPIFAADELRALRAAVMGDQFGPVEMGRAISRIDSLLSSHRASDSQERG